MSERIRHIVSFSGGKASFAAAARVVETYGRSSVTLVFADTLIEDEDLYRFLMEGQTALHCELVWLRDGRTPWEVFRDRKYIGNSRVAPCSHELKIKQVRQWMETHCTPGNTVLHLGISWDEQERLPRAQKNWNKWIVTAPLCWDPFWTERDVAKCLERYDIDRPRLYDMGFPHNNCGGFCVRAGQGQMQALYRQMPERYLWHEEQMESVMRDAPSTRPFIRQSGPNGTNYLTLKQWREQMDAKPWIDMEPAGGCGCFVDEADEAGAS